MTWVYHPLTELTAAERTVDVLKEKVHAMQAGSRSTIQKQLDASRRREEENRRRRDLVEVRAAELARHSASLEAEVARRTMAMRRILNNVTFGFLVVNRNLIVQPEATDSCARLFDNATVEGHSLAALLRLDSRAAATFQLCVDQVFEEVLEETAALSQLGTDFRVGERTLRAEGNVVRDAAGAIEGILFTLSDVTALLAAQRESAENRLLVVILRNRENFEGFIADARQLLAWARDAVDHGDDTTLRRVVHTIKGNAASYDLSEIVAVTHRVEGARIGREGLDAIQAAFAGFLERHEPVLGIRFDAARAGSVDVSSEQIAALKRLVRRLGSPELRSWAAGVTERSADVMLGPVATFASRLGERLGKRVRLEVLGGRTMLDDDLMRPVVQTVVHLVRNAVDHGIEHARGTKPAIGAVEIAIGSTADDYLIRVTDDGNGLDLDALTARAVGVGAVSAEVAASLSDEERSLLLFRDGVSTAPEVSDVSGRGVGLSAVLAAVRGAHGRISVTAQRFRGTAFEIRVPRPSERGATVMPSSLRPSVAPSLP